MKTLQKFCVIFLLAFCVTPVFAAIATVSVQDFQFSPSKVTINIGDTIKWVNNGAATHTTTSDTGLWNQTLASGATFSRTFYTAGSYKYHCTLHPSMKGEIEVRTADQTRILIGKMIVTNGTVPITLNLTGKNANLAYLGSYIVNAQSGCANCHSCPTYKVGNNPYLKQPKKFNGTTYLAGGVNVTGGGVTVVSANITPDATGKPAGLTLIQFKQLLRTGADPDVPGAVIPVMPWPIFGMMSEYELNAIYEYLRAIPRANTPATHCAAPGK